MTTTTTPSPSAADPTPTEPPIAGRTRRVERVGFGGVVVLSLALNAWSLGQNGWGNTFYTAATWSATTSWSNLFFGSFDPGGFITVDKPPVALWIQGLSARAFGFSSWSVLGPSAVAGALSVAILWWILRPRFGVLAAATGALLLAVSPINVAVNRLNLPDPFMIVFLLGASWAILRAAEADRWVRWVLLSAVLIGLAFNTKMLAAAIPGPALALALLIGTAGSLWLRLRRVAVFGLACLLFSVPLIIAVDLTPASSRPFMGGSTNNRVEDLVFGYNGLGRVEGNGQGGGQFGGGGLGGPGGVFGGAPGTFRLVNDAVGGQVAWLLPLAGASVLVALWQFRRDRSRLAATVLWAGWFAITAVVFSYAKGTFHSYYTAALAPSIAALIGIGVAAVRRALSAGGASAIIGVTGTVLALAGTVALQGTLAGRTPDFYGWLRPVVVVGAIITGAVLVIAVVLRSRRPLAIGAVVVAVLVVTATPAAWALSETANPTLNATLPQAGPRGGLAATTFGAVRNEPEAHAFAQYLRPRTRGDRWNLVTTSAMSSSDLIVDQHLSVMALGGFIGSDPASNPTRIAEQVSNGEVRYFLAGGGFGGFGGGGPGGGSAPPFGPGGAQAFIKALPPGFLKNLQAGRPPAGGVGGGGGPGIGGIGGIGQGTANTIMQIVRTTCTGVTDTRVPAQYRSQLYDCLGKGPALAAAARSQSAAADRRTTP